MTAKSACVVGAGVSGIAALKECIRQGFETVCFELDTDIGGIWRKKDYSKPTNTPAIWDTLVTNSSSFNTSYSDFPSDPNDTPYLQAEAVFRYFNRAVEHFGLRKHIRFSTRVIKIRKTADHEKTGRWEVFTTQSGNEIAGNALAGPRGDDDISLSKCRKDVFDFVLICSGYFKLPMYPDISELEKFKGIILHSFTYTNAKPFEGKDVLVVGNKLSGLDIGSDVSNHARQVYLALGNGTWIVPRCFSKGLTIDLLFPRSILHAGDAMVQINNTFIREAENNLNHKETCIRPSKPPLTGTYGLTDNIQLQIMTGKVKIYGRLVRLEENQAHFDDGKVISGLDAIVFCTGYKPDFSFLDFPITDGTGKMNAYKMIFPLDLKHNTLALIGQTAGDGPLGIMFEMQARLATRVMAGKHKLPSHKRMQADIDFWNAHAYARRGKHNSYFISAAMFTEVLAEEIGCYPTFWKVFLKDPILAFRNWYGPIFNAQYRLLGPDSQWEEAVKTCYFQYKEQYSSIRNLEAKDFCRQDIYDYYKMKIKRVVIICTVVAVASIFYKYHDKILKNI